MWSMSFLLTYIHLDIVYIGCWLPRTEVVESTKMF